MLFWKKNPPIFQILEKWPLSVWNLILSMPAWLEETSICGNIRHLISTPVQHFPENVHKECRDKGKAAHCLVFLLTFGGGCKCVMDLSSPIRTNLSTSLYDLLSSIGNGSCVWVACCFAFCFHPRISKGRRLPLLWLWKDFVNQVSQRTWFMFLT